MSRKWEVGQMYSFSRRAISAGQLYSNTPSMSRQGSHFTGGKYPGDAVVASALKFISVSLGVW